MAKLLLGKEVNASINEEIKAKVEKLKAQDITPTLGIIRIGEREDDIAYEKSAAKRCETLGVAYEKFLLPADVKEEEVLKTISQVNKNDKIHGVLLFRPLPKHLNEDRIVNALAVEKDVDGITDLSMAGVFMGKDMGYAPCTPSACMKVLEHYGIDCTGKKVVVIGRSQVVGKPAAMMLLKKNATVTVCHTRTVDMPSVVKEADIVVVAAGKAGVIDGSYLREGQIVIDVGINVNEEGKLCGDVNFEEAEKIVDAITPRTWQVPPSLFFFNRQQLDNSCRFFYLQVLILCHPLVQCFHCPLFSFYGSGSYRKIIHKCSAAYNIWYLFPSSRRSQCIQIADRIRHRKIKEPCIKIPADDQMSARHFPEYSIASEFWRYHGSACCMLQGLLYR